MVRWGWEWPLGTTIVKALSGVEWVTAFWTWTASGVLWAGVPLFLIHAHHFVNSRGDGMTPADPFHHVLNTIFAILWTGPAVIATAITVVWIIYGSVKWLVPQLIPRKVS